VVVVDEVVVVSPTVVEVDVSTTAVGIVVVDTDVVEVDETAVLVSSPPKECQNQANNEHHDKGTGTDRDELTRIWRGLRGSDCRSRGLCPQFVWLNAVIAHTLNRSLAGDDA
jgi:hypothetical protein